MERRPLVLSTTGVTELPVGDTISAIDASDVLSKLITVDGASSGLDADLLDGNHAAAFATSGHNHSGTYEPTLGNPASNGQVLASTAAGVRSWVDSGGSGGSSLLAVAYDNRSNLRSNETDSYAVVDGLGLFQWESGSTEPDDDESCFATTNGRWLLEAAHWDVVDCWQLPDLEAQDSDIEDLQNLPYIITGTAVCSVTSLNTLTQTSFTGTITGAAIGDNAIATPANALTERISVFARVTAANTVTVYLNNPSAATATLTAGTWSIAVIKG